MTNRVTEEMVEAEIKSVYYFTAAEGEAGAELVQSLDEGISVGKSGHSALAAHKHAPEPLRSLTFCVLILQNDFMISAASACVDPEAFDVEVGRSIAFQKAKEQVWQLLGFRLKDQLSQAE